jgi:signal transduction histidine kinase
LQGASAGASYEVKTVTLPLRVFDVDVCLLEGGAASQGWILVMREVTEDRQLQQRLQQQERLAAVGQLAAGIAHDFNNLLTGIIGFTYLLQKHAEMPAAAQPMLARIVTQVERGAHLVRQILDFSRSSVSQLQRLDLARFVKNASTFLQRAIPENIRIVLDVEPGEYVVLADTTRLRQVLMNLAINATEAMPAGGELRLRLSQLTLSPGARPPALEIPPGSWQVLTVSDTGTGIAAADLPRVFEPFFTTKEPGKGSGLGLAQVYGIVKQHDGYIRAESQVGSGTTVAIYLPVVTRETQRSMGVAEPVLPTPIPHGHGETVLLVEDEPAVLEVCYVLLKELGYTVLTATNGQQAMEVYTAHQAAIALVLLDLVMPEMGGEALFKALRQMNPAVKVVIMTGYPLEEEGKQLLAQGILAWVQKPPSIEQLARLISGVLAS